MYKPSSAATVKFPYTETILSSLVITGIVYSAIYLAQYGHLPIPFFYEPSDAFADWFNTAYWSRQSGAYDTWLTVYLPLSFVILRIFGIDTCYPEYRAFDASPGFDARGCDWVAYAAMAIIFTINIVLSFRFFRRIENNTAIQRTICASLGLPMLTCLERGNLLMLAYTFVLLAFSKMISSTRIKWLLVALAVNLKIYLIAVIFSVLLKKRWIWFEGALIFTALVYLISLAIFGDGNPVQIYHNIRNFSEGGAERLLDAWSASTYLPLISILQSNVFPSTLIVGSRSTDFFLVALPIARMITITLIGFAAVSVWMRPSVFTLSRAALIGILMAFSVSETTLYTVIFVILFTLCERWHGFLKKWAISMCYLIAVPLDYAVDTLPERVADFYFTGSFGILSQDVGAGSFVRPLIMLNIAWAISLTTLMEAFRRPSRAASSIPPANDPADTRR